MADFNVNLRELYESAFGISARLYTSQRPYPPTPSRSFDDVELLQEPETDISSVLGTPVFTTFVFQDGTTRDGTEYEGMDLSKISPMVEVDRPRNVKTTVVPDAESTVKELIADGDFQVMIRGILVNMEGESLPYGQIEQLNNLAGLNDAIDVESQLLNRLGIYRLVIRNLRWQRDQNVNAQPFTIDALHDTPEELLIEEAE